jgi:hypothetical protein
MRARTLPTLLATLLAGCGGGVYSTHPASDETTTRPDARLVGLWRVDLEAMRTGSSEPRQDEGGAVFAIGRLPDSERALRVVMVTWSEKGAVESSAFETWPTTIAGRDYASLHLSEKGNSSVVLRYDLSDPDTLRVLAMEEKVVAADVRAGVIAGGVKEPETDPPAVGEGTTVTLDVPTAVLRAYLEKRGDDIYRRERPLVLRRVPLD